MQIEPRLSDEIIPDLNNIVRAIEDEGDRCYLSSTNDADRLREIANWLDTNFRRTQPTSQSDGPPETIDGFETGNTVAPNASQSDEALVEAINDYNSILRSCSQVAKRKGEDTNWDALGKRITRTLEKHHATWLKHWNGKIS